MASRFGGDVSASIYDIAAKARVSPSTVSRALQDHPRIGAKTKERILAVAKELDYVPSIVARSLIANRTWSVGMILPTIADPFMGQVVAGVEQGAMEADLTLFLSSSQHDPQRELAIVRAFAQRRVDAIIVYSSDLNPSQGPADGSRIPTVLINAPEPSPHAVGFDEVPAARLAVEHLLALGHRRIGYVGISNRPQRNQNRLLGYQQALAGAGLALDPALIAAGASSGDDYSGPGEAALAHMRACGATAVFCFNDLTAMGLLSACFKAGIAVPRELSLVGFDDIDWAPYAIPPLTTIRQPRFELGLAAMRTALALLEGKEPDGTMFPGELIVRASTAPPG